ncbi:alpha-amylase family glycosyl hydrolase [Tateyamaria omphalii]|uniref:Alpha-amylase n=1 Tax=Tateyamaria omphalii TaxID=299262 RepID=A0A1P8MR65_9RHOB|nr:alpha-amylase family glycosyl hydrolase [Tateyamaria omphalii]APX10548.1 alpha-amylase [Tateyamaria omphalii]
MAAKARPPRGNWPANPVIYQIYPRSFQDSAGTGEGDLPGITRRLDHVARLGVDGIWLSPFFTSPLCDGGYDVANHVEVDPRFGTMADFDALVSRAHDLGLSVMIDQVFNHTSDQHPWFKASLDRDPEFEDFYVWADARADGSPPSNWIAYFGHPAWQWHAQRGQYCLHQFLPCQPGLNHRDDAVRAALQETTSFWRARGVDGFRFDAITSVFFDPDFPDNPPADDAARALIPGPRNNPFTMQRHDHDMLPKECAAFTRDIREWCGSDTYLLGEINQGPGSIEVLTKFTGPDRLDAGYTIDLPERGLSGTIIKDVLDRLDAPGPMAWWLSSHDQPRQVTRAGDGSARDARMMIAILCALPGPVLLYQGEELGMIQPDLPRDALTDPFDLAYWPDPPGRDGARTPMVWDDTTDQGGFSTASDTWLPVIHPPGGGATRQWADPGSVLRFYETVIAQRRALGLADGQIAVQVADDTLFVARITTADATVSLYANTGEQPRAVDLPPDGHRMLSSAEQTDKGQIAPRSTIWVVI